MALSDTVSVSLICGEGLKTKRTGRYVGVSKLSLYNVPGGLNVDFHKTCNVRH